MKTDYTVGKIRPLPLRRWWLRTRPVGFRALQEYHAEDAVFDPVVEFYVPWWAWPLEFLYILIFGRDKLKAINLTPDARDQLKPASTSKV